MNIMHPDEQHEALNIADTASTARAEMPTQTSEAPAPKLTRIEFAALAVPLTFGEYQRRAMAFANYPNRGRNVMYPTLGIIGEVGEVTEHIKKMMRDDACELSAQRAVAICKELGDVLWYAVALLTELGTVPSLEGLLGYESIGDFSAAWRGTDDWHPNKCISAMVRCASELSDYSEAGDGLTVSINTARDRLYRLIRAVDRLANWCGFSLLDVASANLAKLEARSEAGTLRGPDVVMRRKACAAYQAFTAGWGGYWPSWEELPEKRVAIWLAVAQAASA